MELWRTAWSGFQMLSMISDCCENFLKTYLEVTYPSLNEETNDNTIELRYDLKSPRRCNQVVSPCFPFSLIVLL